jgi:hypothetical protein
MMTTWLSKRIDLWWADFDITSLFSNEQGYSSTRVKAEATNRGSVSIG